MSIEMNGTNNKTGPSRVNSVCADGVSEAETVEQGSEANDAQSIDSGVSAERTVTFIDINQIHPASVERLRAHGCSDREILEFANAPDVASRIDEVPTCYRALFSEGDTEAKILASWNVGNEA